MNILEKLVSILKRDPFYRMKSDYSGCQRYWILFYRGTQAFRGLYKRLYFKESSGLFFCGRRVVIEHGYQISTGPSLVLEDGVHINALSENGITFGRNITIAKGTVIVCTGVIANKGVGLRIGDYSAIGAQSFIGAQGGITIGNDVIMGPGVQIFSENHNFELPDIPIRKQGENRKPVVIEDNCWVGSGVTILGGVTIGEGSVIAARSVVTKNIPAFSVVAGIPAKVIKSRKLLNNVE